MSKWIVDINISCTCSSPHVCWMWTLMRRCRLGELWYVPSLETHSTYISCGLSNPSHSMNTSFPKHYEKFNSSHYKWSIYSRICSNYQSAGQEEILLSAPSIIHLTTKRNPRLVLCISSRIIKTTKEKVKRQCWLWIQFVQSTEALKS